MTWRASRIWPHRAAAAIRRHAPGMAKTLAASEPGKFVGRLTDSPSFELFWPLLVLVLVLRVQLGGQLFTWESVGWGGHSSAGESMGGYFEESLVESLGDSQSSPAPFAANAAEL